MRHASLILTAALLAACQVAPSVAPARRPGELHPVADGVAVTGRLAFPGRFALKQTPKQRQLTGADVHSLKAYVAETSGRSPYRLLQGTKLNEDCNNGGISPTGTLWPDANVTVSGAASDTLTITGLPRDTNLAVTLVAQNDKGATMSCHVSSQETFSTTAEHLENNVVKGLTFEVQLMDLDETYSDQRLGTLVTPVPGKVSAPSAAPKAVGATVVPDSLVVTGGVTLGPSYDQVQRPTLDTNDLPVALLQLDDAYSFLNWQGFNSDGTWNGDPQTIISDANEIPVNIDLAVGRYQDAPTSYVLTPVNGAIGTKIYRIPHAEPGDRTLAYEWGGLTAEAMVTYGDYLDTVYVIGSLDGEPPVYGIYRVNLNCGGQNCSEPDRMDEGSFSPNGVVKDAVVAGNTIYMVTDKNLYSWNELERDSHPVRYNGSSKQHDFTALTYDPAGNRLLLADGPNGTNSVWAYDLAQQGSGLLTLFAGPGNNGTPADQTDYSSAKPTLAARFTKLKGIARATNGDIVVFDQFDGETKMRRITLNP